MKTDLTLLRGDFDDLPPSSQRVIIADVIANIESRDPQTWTNVEKQEIEGLRALRDHIEFNITKAISQNPWLK